MKYLVILLLFISNFQARAQSTDEQQLKDLIQNSFDEILSDLDMDAIPKYYTDDFLLLEVGEVWDLERLRSEMEGFNMNGIKRINEFDFIEIKVKGNSAWIAYHNKAVFQKDGVTVQTIKWLESTTAVKTEVGWRLDMLHSTRKQEPVQN